MSTRLSEARRHGFPRSPQHLSNQLRGKQFNAPIPQLDLFEENFTALSSELQQEVRGSNIKVIGFDLTPPQQRAYEAALFLLNDSGRHQRRIVLTPGDWLRANKPREQSRERNGYAWTEWTRKRLAWRPGPLWKPMRCCRA